LRDSRERALAAWAANEPLDNPSATARLLNALHEAGAADQIAALATRAARPQPAATGTSPRWWKRFARPERRAKPKS
jgi:hypothetical protein